MGPIDQNEIRKLISKTGPHQDILKANGTLLFFKKYADYWGCEAHKNIKFPVTAKFSHVKPGSHYET